MRSRVTRYVAAASRSPVGEAHRAVPGEAVGQDPNAPVTQTGDVAGDVACPATVVDADEVVLGQVRLVDDDEVQPALEHSGERGVIVPSPRHRASHG